MVSARFDASIPGPSPISVCTCSNADAGKPGEPGRPEVVLVEQHQAPAVDAQDLDG